MKATKIDITIDALKFCNNGPYSLKEYEAGELWCKKKNNKTSADMEFIDDFQQKMVNIEIPKWCPLRQNNSKNK